MLFLRMSERVVRRLSHAAGLLMPFFYVLGGNKAVLYAVFAACRVRQNPRVVHVFTPSGYCATLASALQGPVKGGMEHGSRVVVNFNVT